MVMMMIVNSTMTTSGKSLFLVCSHTEMHLLLIIKTNSTCESMRVCFIYFVLSSVSFICLHSTQHNTHNTHTHTQSKLFLGFCSHTNYLCVYVQLQHPEGRLNFLGFLSFLLPHQSIKGPNLL